MNLTSVDAAFSSLSKFFSNGLDNISVDASCDLVSALRHMAPPATNVVQYKRGGRMLGLELVIRELISRNFIFTESRTEGIKAKMNLCGLIYFPKPEGIATTVTNGNPSLLFPLSTCGLGIPSCLLTA